MINREWQRTLQTLAHVTGEAHYLVRRGQVEMVTRVLRSDDRIIQGFNPEYEQ